MKQPASKLKVTPAIQPGATVGPTQIEDHLTVLFTAPGYFASKTIRPGVNGQPDIQNFNAGMFFTVAALPPLTDIQSLSACLTVLEDHPCALVIRGLPLAPLEALQCLPRRKAHFLTPPQGHRWVLIDIDKYPLPKGMGLIRKPTKVAMHLVKLLPAEFHDASYHWQLSSSAGIKRDGTVSMHLWFFLTHPVSDADLNRWGQHVNANKVHKLVDTSLFRDVQPHYTAAPRFIGMADPIAQRSSFCQGAHDTVDLELPPVKDQTTAGTRTGTPKAAAIATTPAGAGFDHHLSTLGDHLGGLGFRAPLLSATASYAATHGADNTNKEALYQTLHDAVLAADTSQHATAEVQEKASRDFIMPMIQSALAKFGAEDRTLRKSRLLTGLASHYQGETLSIEEASRRMVAIMKKGL